MESGNHLRMLIDHVRRAFDLTGELVRGFSEEDLGRQLGDLPSNTIGDQVWCVVGARESYLKAIVNNKWSGFACSIQNKTSREEVLRCLEKSSDDFFHSLDSHVWTENQSEFLLKLLEHEIQHHGQLIRYVYGNKLVFPKSWNERYTV